MKLAKQISTLVTESIDEGKKETLIAFIKQQLGVDLAPLVDDKHSKKFTYMNVDFDELSDIEQRRIQSLAHSSKKFRIEDNGGLGKAFYFTESFNESSEIEAWLEQLKANVEKNTKKSGDHAFMSKTIGWDKGPKFYRVWTDYASGGHKSAYMFIDMEGNLYKAAGWKAPAKGIRGHISKMDTSKHDGIIGSLYAK